MAWRVGIDIGGTFTDFFFKEVESGRTVIEKVLTTPENPVEAVITGFRGVLEREGIPVRDVETIVHGTTLGANTIIERKGAVTGLLCTRGFPDVLEIRREKRFDSYDIFLEFPEPLAPRNLRFEVTERMDARGEVVDPLAEDEVERAVETLRDRGVKALGVCFLNSFSNPAHEKRAGELIRRKAKDLYVSLSVDVLPEIREYERTSTTAANAYIQPVLKDYLDLLEKRLGELGFRGACLIMLSHGGVTTVDVAAQFPVRILESGPAGGALGAAGLCRVQGLKKVVAFDMGGTTAKVALIKDAEPLVTTEFEVARAHGMRKGSGFPIRVPTIDLLEIGAGGGSIAAIDDLGMIKVGPESAGAAPGPACYGRGGKRATVTDADLLLGYLNPDFFLGGRLKLDPAGARRAVSDQVAGTLGVEVIEAAWGIHEIANAEMANAVGIHCVERGEDVRNHSLIAFGGAGPVHACHVARKLGIPEVLIPPGAGVSAAAGFLAAPFSFDFVRSDTVNLSSMDLGRVRGLLAEMEAEGRDLLRKTGVPPERVEVKRLADMRYRGQGHEVMVPLPPLPPGPVDAEWTDEIGLRFDRVYTGIYGRTNEGMEKQAVSWRVRVSGPTPEAGAIARPQGADSGVKGKRTAYFRDHKPTETSVYDRGRLGPETAIQGPAIIEEEESTTVVPRGAGP